MFIPCNNMFSFNIHGPSIIQHKPFNHPTSVSNLLFSKSTDATTNSFQINSCSEYTHIFTEKCGRNKFSTFISYSLLPFRKDFVTAIYHVNFLKSSQQLLQKLKLWTAPLKYEHVILKTSKYERVILFYKWYAGLSWCPYSKT